MSTARGDPDWIEMGATQLAIGMGIALLGALLWGAI